MLVNKGLSSGCHPVRQHANAQRQRVSSSSRQGPLAEKNWDDAMQPWTTVPEVSMSPAQVNALLAQQANTPARRPHPRTVDEGLDEVSRRARIGPGALGPTPPAEPWPAGA